MITADSLTGIYERTLIELKKAKEQESQFGNTLELINYSCCLTNPRSRFVRTQNRMHSLRYLIGELCWYLSGEKSTDRISNYSSFWEHLAEDGRVNSNYGDKIFHKLIPIVDGKTQFWRVIDELKRDINSRRAIMFLNLLDEDYPQMHTTKDFSCTPYLHFLIRNNQLHMLTYMRSNDFIYGFCNDVPFFTILQELIAVKLGVGLGCYYHNAGSEHIYKKHFYLLNYKPAPLAHLDKRDGEVFPEITEEDNTYLFQLPVLEKEIREGKKYLEVDKSLPEFTKFVIQELIEIWK